MGGDLVKTPRKSLFKSVNLPINASLTYCESVSIALISIFRKRITVSPLLIFTTRKSLKIR